MTSTIITALVGLVCTLASSIVTFLLTKRKYDAEVESQTFANVKDAFDLHKEITDGIIKAQNDKIDRLQRESEDLRKQVQHLQNQVLQLLNVNFETSNKG